MVQMMSKNYYTLYLMQYYSKVVNLESTFEKCITHLLLSCGCTTFPLLLLIWISRTCLINRTKFGKAGEFFFKRIQPRHKQTYSESLWDELAKYCWTQPVPSAIACSKQSPGSSNCQSHLSQQQSNAYNF